MQGGVAGSVCFFAFLLYLAQAKQDLASSEDLKTVITQSTSVEEEKTGAVAESLAYSDGGSSQSEALAESIGGSAIAQSLAASGGYGSNSAKAHANTQSGLDGSLSSYSIKDPYWLGLSPSSSSATAKAEALAQMNSGALNHYQSPYQPGSQINSITPYGSGSSSQALAQTQTLPNSGIGGVYNPGLSPHLPGYLHSPGANSPGMNSYYQPISHYNSAQTQTDAQAMINSNYGGGSSYGSGLSPYQSVTQEMSPYSSGSSSTLSQVEAQALSNSGGSLYNPRGNSYYRPGSPSAQRLPSSSAQAEAQAIGNNEPSGSYNSVLNPYQLGYQTASPQSFESNSAQAQVGNQYPLSLYGSGLSTYQAQSEAQAIVNNGGGQFYNSGKKSLQPGYYYKPESSSIQAQAEAILNSVEGGYGQRLIQYPLPAHSLESNSAQAQSAALAQFNGKDINSPGQYLHSQGYPRGYNPTSGYNQAQAQAQALFGSYGSGDATAQAQAVSNGASNTQSSAILVADVRSRFIPIDEYTRPHLIPGAEDAILCTSVGELHNLWLFGECFVCSCIEESGIIRPVCASCFGCMASVPEPATIVPTPSPPPQPKPEVSCSPLPSNQPFQNPLNPCQLCMCKEITNVFGVSDVLVECYDNPECVLSPEATTFVPRPVPVPESITQPPLPIPIPISPVPFPDIVTPEPLPWQPVPVPTPPPHGPLPGPPPHESCRPFTPNQPFQHPWDECQQCVCTESYAVGLVTIEINCYTKQSCCYESPHDAITVTTAPYAPTPPVQMLDKICEYKTFGVEFTHPQDNCRVCTCELNGNFIKSVCQRSAAPQCAVPYIPGISSTNAESYASAQSNIPASQSNVLTPPKNVPSLYKPYFTGSLNLPSENSLTLQEQRVRPGIIGANPVDTYTGQKLSDLPHLSGYSPYQPGYYQGNMMSPNSNPYASSYLAKTEGVANGLSNYNQYQAYYTGSSMNRPSSSSLTNPESMTSGLSAYNQKQLSYYSDSIKNYLNGGSTSALANAEVLANLLSGNNDYLSSYNTGSNANYPGSSLSSADAMANAQSSLISPYAYSVPVSSLYPSLYPSVYPIQNSDITSYYPGVRSNIDSTGSVSQTQALSLSQGSNTQSQATANAGGGFRTKSADDDVSIEETESWTQCLEQGLTPDYLLNIKNMKHVAAFKDAQHRGPRWYDSSDSASPQTDSDMKSEVTDSSSSESTETISSSDSSDASSQETNERRRATRVYRTCHACPTDMLKQYKNVGIKWICGGYQRARRSFKSECMMRYRNCQDGTMFVKLSEHRCKNDTYRGRHWFYVYRV